MSAENTDRLPKTCMYYPGEEKLFVRGHSNGPTDAEPQTRGKMRRKRRHIPHSDRSSEYVERRNSRERRRTRRVNQAFRRLRLHLPGPLRNNPIMSKYDILTASLRYIRDLMTEVHTPQTEPNTPPQLTLVGDYRGSSSIDWPSTAAAPSIYPTIPSPLGPDYPIYSCFYNQRVSETNISVDQCHLISRQTSTAVIPTIRKTKNPPSRMIDR